jgi:hypothetical protein
MELMGLKSTEKVMEPSFGLSACGGGIRSHVTQEDTLVLGPNCTEHSDMLWSLPNVSLMGLDSPADLPSVLRTVELAPVPVAQDLKNVFSLLDKDRPLVSSLKGVYVILADMIL